MTIRDRLNALEARLFPARFKRKAELGYWLGRQAAEGTLRNGHYERAYTTAFGLDRAFYGGKHLLDIGCGPRGSLEWATMAAERIGLDPLVPAYRKLGIGSHAMTYVAAPSERIPYADGAFDVVTTFNSLDHVDHPRRTVAEIGRVTRPGGVCLILVEVNHPPTETEPHPLPWDVATWFQPEFTLEWQRTYEVGPAHDLYGQVFADARYDDADRTDRAAWLQLMLRRDRTSP
jgi:SAM-dependent methyltransferase